MAKGCIFLLTAKLTLVLNLFAYGQEVETINRYRQSRLADEFYEKGLYCFEKDRIPEAVEYLTKSTSLDPNNYLAYYFLGASYESLPDPEKSLLNYNLSLALKPDFSEGLFSRANLLMRTGNYEQAVADFNHLLNIPAGETQAIYFKGIGYGDKDADTGFDELLTMADREVEIQSSLAQCYTHLNQYDSAVIHASKSIRLEPDEDLYYVNRGLAYMKWGKTDSARDDFQKALKLNPDNSLAAYNLSILDPDDTIESLEQLNRIIKNNSRLPFAYAGRAYYHYRQGNYEQAKLDYDSAIMLEENNASYYLNRGMCYEKMNNLTNTLRDYLSASALDPGDPKIWYNLGNIFYKQESYQDAVAAYSTSIRIDSQMGNVYFNRGLTYFQIGDSARACQDMQQAISMEVDPARRFFEKNCNQKNK